MDPKDIKLGQYSFRGAEGVAKEENPHRDQKTPPYPGGVSLGINPANSPVAVILDSIFISLPSCVFVFKVF